MKKIVCTIAIIILSFTLISCVENNKNDITDDVIHKFLDKYANNYLTKNSDGFNIDYNVVQGIKLLEQVDSKIQLTSYLSQKDASEYVDSLDYSLPVNFFKASVIDKAYNMVSSKPKEKLSMLTEVDVWSINYVYGALNYYSVNQELKTKIQSQLYVIRDEDYRDADYAGITLAVTIKDRFEKQPLLDLIKNSIVKGGVSTWGNLNAASTASAIIGLTSLGIDLNKNYLDEDGNSLIINLLSFEEQGAFKWEKDGEIDLNFSTPQGFLACVCYKVFTETQKPVEVF